MKHNFKEKEWIYCEFKLMQVRQIEDGRVTSVSDGYGTLSGSSLNDSCYPLTMDIKVHSEYVKNLYDILHKEAPAGLNFPDIKRDLVRRWKLMCETTDKKVLQEVYAGTRGFVDGILEALKTPMEIEGIKLFRS